MPIIVEFVKKTLFQSQLTAMSQYLTKHAPPPAKKETHGALKELIKNMGLLIKTTGSMLEKDDSLVIARNDEKDHTVQALAIITRSPADSKIHIDLICNAPWNLVPPGADEANAPVPAPGGPYKIMKALVKTVAKLTLDPAGEGPRKAFARFGFTSTKESKGHMEVSKEKFKNPNKAVKD